MNKKELCDEMSKRTELTKKECTMCVEALQELITETVKKGEAVNLIGFGRFKLQQRKAKQAYNPITKKMISKPAHKVPVFRSYKNFKETVNS